MIRVLFALCFVLAFWGCSEKNTKGEIKSISTETPIIKDTLSKVSHNTPPHSAPDSNQQKSTPSMQASFSEEQRKVAASVLIFYNWYIDAANKNIQKIDVELLKGENGKTNVSTTSYFNNLKSLKVMSDEFFKSETNRLKKCQQHMATIDYKVYKEADAYEYEDWCDIYFYYWLRDMELPQFAEVSEVQIKNNEAIAHVLFGNKDEANSKKYWNKYAKVKLHKKSDKYLIDEIEVIFFEN